MVAAERHASGMVLVVDDDEDVLTASRVLLRRAYGTVCTEKDPSGVPDLVRRSAPDVVLLDMNFTPGATSGAEGVELLDRIREADPLAVVVAITAYGEVEVAVEAMKHGAADFVVKPWQNERLLATTSMAFELARSRREAAHLRRERSLAEDSRFHDMIGGSPAMRAIFATIAKVAATDASVLVLGENGTGKELVARAIHRASARADRAFVGVDMGAIAPGLFESELFGHVKGAFTDARDSRAGLLEVASGGTLFLDEVGNLGPAEQAKLLRALEERTVTPVGSTSPRAVDLRIASATSLPRSELANPARFRQDLLYRINTVEILIPPLRERAEDIPALARFYLEQYSRRHGGRARRLAPDVLAKLCAYPWPGNVRELRHAVERAVILSDGEEPPVESFLPAGRDSAPSAPADLSLAASERASLLQALERASGSITEAARLLGISRASLYRRIEKHGLR